MKLLRRTIIGFVALLIAAVIIIKLFVGAINVPVMPPRVEPNRLETRLQVPQGFQLRVFAKDLPGARALRFTRQGDLLISFPRRDEILLLQRDKQGNNIGRKVVLDKRLLAKAGVPDFKGPNGMDFYRDAQQMDWLYVAEEEAIGRIRFDHHSGATIGVYQRIITDLPGGGNHWKKTLRFGPDGLLYVAIGSSCNVCIEKDKRRAAIMRYQPNGAGEQIYASGLRNSAGFDWNAQAELYATDNGRDLLGDDFPPCEFNKIEQGEFYGWPFANGPRIKDPDYGENRDNEIASSREPSFGFRAHNAPLGMTFIRNTGIADAYKDAALVALHGSWNRSKKDGYKVVSLHRQADGSFVEKDFVSGFLKDDQVIGRPVDVVEGPDGAFYISDDFAGVIYRVVYNAGNGNQ